MKEEEKEKPKPRKFRPPPPPVSALFAELGNTKPAFYEIDFLSVDFGVCLQHFGIGIFEFQRTKSCSIDNFLNPNPVYGEKIAVKSISNKALAYLVQSLELISIQIPPIPKTTAHLLLVCSCCFHCFGILANRLGDCRFAFSFSKQTAF